MSRVLVIDHKDSFVFILAEQLHRLGATIATYRSDELDVPTLDALVAELGADLVVLSPGPGRSETAGVTVPWLRTAPVVPVLGVCLGHQAMVCAAGGTIERAPTPAHGVAATIALEPDPLFGDARHMTVARYHSLAATRLPDALRALATLDVAADAPPLVMALRHTTLPWVGLQFHPESVLTPDGPPLLARILDAAVAHRAQPSPLPTTP